MHVAIPVFEKKKLLQLRILLKDTSMGHRLYLIGAEEEEGVTREVLGNHLRIISGS